MISIKKVLNMDFLLFVFGIYWLDIADYIQKTLAACDPKAFGFISAVLFYIIIQLTVKKTK